MQTVLKTSLAAVAPLFLMATAIHAEDWPQWRGPNRDAAWSETGLLQSFPAEGLKVRWRSPVGYGWSSPVVAQGRVFLTDAELKNPKANERIHCFDETTGKPLWTYAYDVRYPDWAFTAGQEGRPTSTPIVSGGKVYAVGLLGSLFCFDALKGDVLWKKDLDKEYLVQEFSCRSSPLIDGNLLILFIGSFIAKSETCVVALDRDSGKEVWKAGNETVTNSSPIIITAGGKRQLIVWTAESVISLDPASGKIYWRERMKTDNVVATPVYRDHLLLIGGMMLKLSADKPEASILWPDTKAAGARTLSNTSTALILGDHVYSAKSSGELVCLDAKTGKQVWQNDKVTDLKNGASIHLTPAGDAVFLYTDRGELIRAELTPKGYKENSRARLVEPTNPFSGRNTAWAPPAYANRHVFARNDKELVCASLAKP
jgi:outer membrane protein assembly factor BamB